MKKYPNKFKLTPEAYKALKKIATDLPKVPKTDKNGNPVFQTDWKRVKGYDLPMGVKVDGKDPEANANYKKRVPVMQWQNHEVSLVDAWQKLGQTGVDAYVKWVKAYAAAIEAASRQSKKKIPA